MRRLLLLAVVGAALWAAPGALAAGWCGTGASALERPDVTTGDQVHAIVAVPADGPDNFAADANVLADDVATMTAWWQAQDPTRVPRFDMATFPSGSCLDISFVRLGEPGSTFSGADASTTFQEITSELEAPPSSFSNPGKKYYVYYDGPTAGDGVCGVGAGAFDNSAPAGYAVVYLAGCPDIQSVSVGTHELLHALGALPIGAPNACTPADDPFLVFDPGHPCDSNTDVLYPAATGAPFAQQVLDYNHDDYYGHSGSWYDIQDSLWMHRLDLPPVSLAVSLSGAGHVTSDVPGLDCTANCTTQWDQGSRLTLHGATAPGKRFVRWSGACSGAGDCALDLTAPAAATAIFGPTTITTRLSTAGRGHIECSPRCTKAFPAGTHLTLRALPAKGWRFIAWSGACKGKRVTCSPSTNASLVVKATFGKALRKR